jgi:uncharacterized protein (TIGR03000 family)
MYSVVLMMALSGGGETIDASCNGCSSSHGCHARSRSHGCHGGLFSRFHNRGGCHGCNGGGCHGGGGCHVVSHGCNGGGCHGGCHSRGHGGFGRGHGCSSSCHGGLFSRLHNRCNGGGCHGCNGGGCHGCAGSAGCACSGTVVPGGATPEKVKVMPKEERKKNEEASNNSAATIVVSLPADARLTVDGNATRSTSDRRTFVTPALESGMTYVYTLRAEVVVDGQTSVQTQDVTVKSGETSNVTFTFVPQGVASR